MYLVRRVSVVKQWKEWEAAGLLYKFAKAYERAGRSECRVYMSGEGTPGPARHIYVDWVTEKIEAPNNAELPQEVFDIWEQLKPLLEEYYMEFYELMTQEKIEYAG